MDVVPNHSALNFSMDVSPNHSALNPQALNRESLTPGEGAEGEGGGAADDGARDSVSQGYEPHLCGGSRHARIRGEARRWQSR